ncbi:META domain-containing protein [Arthrobacter sp. R4-81]
MAGSLLSRKARVLPLAVALAVALGGCGDLPGAPAVKPTVPVASTLSEPPVPLDSLSEPGVPQETMPAGTTTPYPQPSCQGGPLGCRAFTSVGGRDGTGELEWLKAQPLEVSSIFMNSTWTIAVKTPCNMMSVGVTVKGNLLIPGMTLLTQMACQGPEDSYENWTHELFKQAVTWELAGESLVLRNSHGTVELKDSGPIPYG